MKILKNIVASASEFEIVSAFENGQNATVIRRTLMQINHPQPQTPKQVYNTTEISFFNGNLKEKYTKSIDMKYHRLKSRQVQKEFQFHWMPGKFNLADTFTKYQAGKEHLRFRNIFNL